MRMTLAFGLALIATQAAAYELSCTFDQECFEGDACAETAFSASLDMTVPPEIAEMSQGTPIARFHATLITDAETIEGVYMTPFPETDSTGVFVSLPAGVTHTVTITGDLRARYVATFAEDGFVMSYSGTCEALPE